MKKHKDISIGLKDTKFTYSGLEFVFDGPWNFDDVSQYKFYGCVIQGDDVFITHTGIINICLRGTGISKTWEKSVELSFKDLFKSLKRELSGRKKALKAFEDDMKLIG